MLRLNKALEKSHFWVRVRAFYVWGEKKRKREEEEEKKKEEGRREEKESQGMELCLEPLLYGNLFRFRSLEVWNCLETLIFQVLV